MRPIPILTAVVVSFVLFLLIMQRDAVIAFATGGATEDKVATTVATAEQAPAADEAPERAIGVVVQRSTARQIDSAVVLRGETRVARKVEVRAETSGQVISEPLRKGAFVEAGQLLCEIDPGTRPASLAEARARLAEALARVPEAEASVPTAEAALETARAQLDEARINENAARKLSQGGFASETRVAAAAAALRAAEGAVKSAEAGVKSAQAALLNAQAGIQGAEAAVAGADKELERLKMHAPFAGLLETDTAELGSLLQPGAVCATVIQLDPIKVAGFVPETEVGRVAVGALAGARLTDGSELRGRVTFLSRSADQTTRTFLVEIDVPNPGLEVRDGQTAEILIAAEGQQSHLLPQSALTLDDNGTLGVRTVNGDSRVAFAPVTMLRDTVQGVWLTGLPETADIIVVGQEYVTDGVLVTPTYREVTQ